MIKTYYQISQEEIITGEELLLTKYVVIREDNKIKYSKSLSFNYQDPKEYARVKLYVDLLDKYGYPAEKIEFEVLMPDSTPDSRADMVIYEDEEKKKPYIVVECKKDDISDAEFEKAVKQVIMNANLLNAQFAVCTTGNKRKIIEIKRLNPKNPYKAIIDDLPYVYKKKENKNI